MNATEIAATLSVRAADVCRRYLPRGSKQGRYWTVGDTNGAKGRSLFVRLALRHTREMDRRRDQQAWISARSHPSAHRRSIAAPRHGGGPRVPLIAAVHSRQWRRHRGRAALLARPQATRQGQPRPPAQSTWACPRQGCAIRRVRHWRDPACRHEGIETVLSLVTAVPGIHAAAAALSAGSLGAFEPPQDLPLLVIARDKDVEGRHAANRLQRRCMKRGIPSIVIVPERSDFNDDLIAFGQETLAARIAPLIASTKPGATVEERRGSGRIISPS